MRAVRSNPSGYHWTWEGQPTGKDFFNVCVHIRGRELVMHLHPGGDGFRRHRYGMGGAYVRDSLHNDTDVVQKAGLDAAHDLS
ncbi:MAG: hypothetical protein HOV68_15165 [Streptomycetaceae bacterium]|nr:hypothetical protein [Streptomycetaceae bacterium]